VVAPLAVKVDESSGQTAEGEAVAEITSCGGCVIVEV